MAELRAQTLTFIFSPYRDKAFECLNYQNYANTVTFMTGEKVLSKVVNSHTSTGTVTLLNYIHVTKTKIYLKRGYFIN